MKHREEKQDILDNYCERQALARDMAWGKILDVGMTGGNNKALAMSMIWEKARHIIRVFSVRMKV